ncbi:MAG: acetolactate decarboxylase [Legionellaceae bacterium]|nr:acetolactate decarboxylase [Legionellaceae bacterium]
MAKLYQYSHFLAVNRGLYDGDLSIEALTQQGNIGLGTFNALDGELVVIDGVCYQCAEGNQVRRADASALMPWAAVSSFTTARKTATVADTADLPALTSQLLTHAGSSNYPYVFQLHGVFHQITIASAPKQEKPYASIETVIEQSTQLETGPIHATLVGFYAPDFMFPIKGKGLHLHCVSDDQAFGGHVLDVHVKAADVSFEAITKFDIELPRHELYAKTDMTSFEDNDHVPSFKDKSETIVSVN